MSNYKTIDELKGKTLTLVECGKEEAVFTTLEGPRYRMYHEPDCCESVTLEAVDGRLDDILDSPVTAAVERPGHDDGRIRESITFTDFEITTEKGSVTFKWVGESNGYYGESPYFVELK